MLLFDYLKTGLDLFIAFMNQEALVCIAFICLGFLLLWAVGSICFCYETDFKNDCERVTKFVKNNKINRDNYPVFTTLFLTMSTSVRRAWKSYELCVGGMPSDYLKQFECLDMQINGGHKTQAKNVMNFYIYAVVVFLAVMNLGINLNYASMFTAQVLVESMLLPLTALLVYKAVYYIYLAIRNYEYKMAVSNFNDMVDILDETISLAEIFEGYEDAIAMVSNVYSNETLNKLKVEENLEAIRELKRKQREEELQKQEKIRQERMDAIAQERARQEVERKMNMIEKIKSTLPKDYVDQEEGSKPMTTIEPKVVENVEEKKGRGRPKKESAPTEKVEEKKGRGRPKKETVETEKTEVKKGRGRPKKEVAPTEKAEEKKGRGRPKKETVEKVMAAAPHATVLKEKVEVEAIENQKQFVTAMNEVEGLLDANATDGITDAEIESNNARIDALVAKMMDYKQKQ